jgi:hypothetical protein
VPGPALPPLQGNYHSVAAHPRVFTTGAELKELASRINRPGSYFMQRFGQLAGQIARDLAARNDWNATYAGCDFGAYQYAFSYEPQDGREAATHALLKFDAGTIAPAGAAVVASRLALYAALIKAGAAAPASAPSADQAAGLAKRILLAWADRGFKDATAASGNPRRPATMPARSPSPTPRGFPWCWGGASSIRFTPRICCNRSARSTPAKQLGSMGFTPPCSS